MAARRFTDEVSVKLRRTMRLRAPDYHFADVDYDTLLAETGLTAKQVERWEENFRYNVKGEARAAYLDKDDETVWECARVCGSS